MSGGEIRARPKQTSDSSMWAGKRPRSSPSSIMTTFALSFFSQAASLVT
jgi:hypothetical protein